jgi:hypothetical protein
MNNIQALLDLNTLLLKQNAALKKELHEVYMQKTYVEVERDSLLSVLKIKSNFQGTFQGEAPF